MSMKLQAPAKQKWYVQLKETYGFTAKEVPLLWLRLLAIFALTYAVIIGIGFAVHLKLTFGIAGFGIALLVTTFVFGKIAEKSAYMSIAGQVGAAASVLNALRAGWFTTPAVGIDKNQNMVHRVVGRPGIILVGEGSRPGVLIAEQRKAHARYAPGVPIHEITVGEGGTSILELQKTVRKLPKSLRPAEVTDVRRRLEALPKNAIPIPKGPMPQGRKVTRR